MLIAYLGKKKIRESGIISSKGRLNANAGDLKVKHKAERVPARSFLTRNRHSLTVLNGNSGSYARFRENASFIAEDTHVFALTSPT